MSGQQVFSMWVFVVVAMSIAATAFAVGRVTPGAGVPVAALGATLWVAYVARRGRGQTNG